MITRRHSMSCILTLFLLVVQIRKSMSTCFRNLPSVCEVIGKPPLCSPCSVMFFKNVLKEFPLWTKILSSICVTLHAQMVWDLCKFILFPVIPFRHFFFPGRTQRSLWIMTTSWFLRKSWKIERSSWSGKIHSYAKHICEQTVKHNVKFLLKEDLTRRVVQEEWPEI